MTKLIYICSLCYNNSDPMILLQWVSKVVDGGIRPGTPRRHRSDASWCSNAARNAPHGSWPWSCNKDT